MENKENYRKYRPDEKGKEIVSQMFSGESFGPYDFRKVRIRHLPLSSYSVRALRGHGVFTLAGVMSLTERLLVGYESRRKRTGVEITNLIGKLGFALQKEYKHESLELTE